MNWLQKWKTRIHGKRSLRTGREYIAQAHGRGKASGWAELDRQTALPRRIMNQGIK